MRRTNTKLFFPAVDRLDARRLMATGLKATLANGVLTVKGTAAADVISVQDQGGVVAVAGVAAHFKATRIRRIDILGGKGDDTIVVQVPSARVRVDGGAGANTVNGVPDRPRAVTTPTPTPPQILPVPAAATVNLAPATVSSPAAPVSSPTATVNLPAATASTPAASVSNPATVATIVELTNAQRVQAGLAPLTVSSSLMRAATIQADNMARLDVMSHTLPGTDAPTLGDRAAAVGYQFTTLGENIAFNYADAEAVVAGWLGSPGHRANILNPSVTQTGVAVAINAQGEPYYAQEFGNPA